MKQEDEPVTKGYLWCFVVGLVSTVIIVAVVMSVGSALFHALERM